MRRRLAGILTRRILPRAPLEKSTYELCKAYVNSFNGENNVDFRTNGELALLYGALGSSEGQTVFDVGANRGEWSRLALTVNPGIDLHCFEPSKATFDRLKSAGLPDGVIFNNCGLGEKSEERSLYVFEPGSELNSLYRCRGLEMRGRMPQQSCESVSVLSVDDYCAANGIERIDFMKIDVEGHELHVIRGAAGLLSRKRIDLIQFEYNGWYIMSRIFLLDMYDYLTEHGYRLYKLHADHLQLISQYDQRLENMQYSNYVAASPAAEPKVAAMGKSKHSSVGWKA